MTSLYRIERRVFLGSFAAAWSTGDFLLQARAANDAAPPNDDPLARYKLAWTGKIRWSQVIDFSKQPGANDDERLAAAQQILVKRGGGVVYFPAGTYRFRESIWLQNGVVLRGAAPPAGTSAHDAAYALPTKFEFPRYQAKMSGDAAVVDAAFRGIYLADPAVASDVGVAFIDLNRGHIHFADDGTEKHAAGSRRFVVGCVLRNAAVPDPGVPDLAIGQHAWQRFTARHHAAIDVKAETDLLVAGNRLPPSGDDNFTMDGFVLQGRDKKPMSVDGVVFDYDNRPGLYVNHYGVGGAGGSGPDGTPETHPYGFRRGIVIADNYVYNTGRMGIGFCGDGVVCRNNVIRFPEDLWRPTATGKQLTFGSSTNDNRAIEMRGWRWIVDGNDYVVHRNWAYDRKYKINDGEGLMHEDHVNATIRDSVLTNNRGNTYLSLYKTAGIDGLLVEGNEIRLGDGRQTIASGSAIFVSADRTKDRFPCRNVRIVKNTVAGGGILLSGDPSSGNVIRGNKYDGPGTASLLLQAEAEVADNRGFEIKRS
jgi:hypothetical protein